MTDRTSAKDVRIATDTVMDGDIDEAELARMGYKQELNVITGVSSLFAYGLNTGGPAVMVWGWIVVACFTMCVGLAMAEVCSAHPTSGGPYFWAAMLCKPEDAAFASWITGWFNLLGQVAVTTGISFACATFISTLATFDTTFGLINTFGVHLLRYLNNISVWWHAIGTVALIIAVLAAAPSHQSAHFVFQTFVDGTGIDGPGWSQRASPAYVVIVGILMAQYTLTGILPTYCIARATNMTEETHNAAMSGPIGIVMAIGVSAVLGWFLILGLLFSIQDLTNTVGSATGEPVAQIFLDTVGEKGAIVLMVIVIGSMFWCGTFSITSNSRMMYAFARDGGIPGHTFFHKVDVKRKSPIRTVWLALGSSVAFSAATSIATIGLYISYGIPIALRVIYAHASSAGQPRDSQTLNYAIVAVGIVVTYSLAEATGVDVMDPAIAATVVEPEKGSDGKGSI
ncbi:amino acid/polyamine transporter I [Fomitopsis serialis]|uniref:amino acid/polyamine transporter I n=1 Tax=Fomitopsis serialis TaxID=139415 RepID=UPI0020089A15|nr:amino acid/polyamine transporter I [Neoantrodia serialis]KAH9920626.1 amino acid/polyamine transporter I [Neoantrodia serialis]